MTSRTRLLVFLVSAPVIAFAILGGFLGNTLARGDDTYSRLRVFQDVVSLITNNYVEEPDIDKVMRGALRGLAEGLDPDSAYLTAQQVRQLESRSPLPPGDVGLELTHQYYLRVVAARDGSPAARAGVQPGDFVRVIDGEATRDMSAFEGERRLRGTVGSKVTLTVIRGNAAEPHVLALVREARGGPEVRSRMQAEGVGYIRVAAFGRRIAEQLRGQVLEMSKAGATRLVVDVRNTADGEFADGIAAARLFVPSGTLAILESRGTGQQPVTASKGDGAIALPVVILIDSGTSGAAEIFAAALAGNKRAELVGERTLGRAAVQELVKLPDGSGLWIAVSRYLTPAGTALLARGLEPDVAVSQPELEFGAAASSDPILERAIGRLAARNPV